MAEQKSGRKLLHDDDLLPLAPCVPHVLPNCTDIPSINHTPVHDTSLVPSSYIYDQVTHSIPISHSIQVQMHAIASAKMQDASEPSHRSMWYVVCGCL